MNNIMKLASIYADKCADVREYLGGNAGIDEADPYWVAMKEARAALEAAVEKQAAEISALQAKLSAMEAVEPLFYYRPTCNGEMYEGPHHAKSVGGRMLREEKPTEWIALYTAPKVAQQPSKPTFAEWCATNWDGPPSANARDAYNRIIGGQQP